MTSEDDTGERWQPWELATGELGYVTRETDRETITAAADASHHTQSARCAGKNSGFRRETRLYRHASRNLAFRKIGSLPGIVAANLTEQGGDPWTLMRTGSRMHALPPYELRRPGAFSVWIPAVPPAANRGVRVFHEDSVMELRDLGPDGQSALEGALGYLNFSAGAEDLQFLANVNLLYGLLESPDSAPAGSAPAGSAPAGEPTWSILLRLLSDKLSSVEGQVPAFQDARQARLILDRLRDPILPGYRAFHRDLLFHHTDQTLFRPFMLGRICEALLQQGSSWDTPDVCRERTIRLLNDYVGYRPVAVLENRTLEPYPHERVRPIPIYVRGAGIGHGPYQAVVRQALEMLQRTDPQILRAARFDPSHLDELAIDPRAYDFDHPVNKRPNYHFGQWDPHAINNHGFYHRFIVQQVTLDSLMDRLQTATDLAPDEVQTEAAAVLAGTILMASGISGWGPDCYDSNTTLGNLLPSIASYRDSFYERLIEQLAAHAPAHAQRLIDESRRLRQPFGAARQHLNAQLTRRRASQLERVRLASVFARMGHPEAAQRQIDAVPVASARMLCQIDCNLTRAQRLMDLGRLQDAGQQLRDSRQILGRAINCGAVVDPWNILGFDGNFSLFPAMENSIHDHRVDELLDLMEEIFDTYGRLWSLAAAARDEPLCQSTSLEMEELTKWWHQFAVHEVSCVDCSDPLDTYRAARNVAEALRHWHAAGEATAAIKFWAPYVEQFDSPKAYATVIEMLLDRRDTVAARALLVHWLGQAETVSMEQGEDSFYRLASRWLAQVLKLSVVDGDGEAPSRTTHSPIQAEDWNRVRKFFDYLEANGGAFWQVPSFGSYVGFESGEESDDGSDESEGQSPGDEESDDSDAESLFDAAYEGVVYRDSTDDGVEGAIYDTSSGQNDALDATHDQIVSRLAFLNSLSRLRRIAAIAWMLDASAPGERPPIKETLRNWLTHTWQVRDELEDLVMDVYRHRLARPSHDYLSLAEFDRERTIKESLMEHVIAACVEASQCAYFLICALLEDPEEAQKFGLEGDVDGDADLSVDEILAIRLVAAALRGNADESRRLARVEGRAPLGSRAVCPLGSRRQSRIDYRGPHAATNAPHAADVDAPAGIADGNTRADRRDSPDGTERSGRPGGRDRIR